MGVIEKWLCLLASTAIAVGCSRSQPPASATKPAAAANSGGVAAVSNAGAAPAIILAKGFTYNPDEATPGYPGVTTIRLGDRLRIYSIASEWTPATLALLDRDKNVLWSIRLDLPPRGSINGAIPAGIEPAEIRITRPGGSFDASRLERRIGTTEPEWSGTRMKELGIVPVEEQQTTVDHATVTASSWKSSTFSNAAGFDPNLATIIALTPSGMMESTTPAWNGTGPAPDDFWLTVSVRSYLDEELASAAGTIRPTD